MGNSKSKRTTVADDEGANVTEDEIPEVEESAPNLSQLLSPEQDAKLLKQVTVCLKTMSKYPSSATKQRKALAKLRHYCNDSEGGRAHRTIHHIITHQGQTLVERAMKNHSKMAALQNHACRVMALLARGDPKATISTLPLLLQTMKTHKRNVNLQCNGLSTLSFWGMYSEEDPPLKLAIQIVEAGAYPVIFQLMLSSSHEANLVIQDKALKTLVILAGSDKKTRTAFVSAQAWRALTACLSRFDSNSKVQLKGIKIMKALAQDFPSVISKRLDMVLIAMKLHIHDAPIQRAGCTMLLLLASTHPACHPLLINPGGGRDSILAAMRQHASNEEIQKTAILCLQKLPYESLYDPPSNSPTSTGFPDSPPTTGDTSTFDAITQGLEAMINTLNKEETTAPTCTNICKALIKLAMASHTNKLDIASANGLEGIVAAMRRYPDEVSLQRYACQALGQLAMVDATKRAIVQEAHGAPVVTRAIFNHCETTHLVALHGILLLVRLSQVADNHQALLKAPIVPAVVRAMKCHREHKALQHKSMFVLHKLASRHVRAKLPMVQAGSLEAVLQAMTQHSDDMTLQKMGCSCLFSLHHNSTARAMIQAGSLEVVVDCMEQYGDSIGMQLTTLRTILEITQFSCHLQYWASDHVGGLPCLVAALRRHADHAAFQELAFEILQKSSATPTLRRPLVQAGGIPVVMAGMRIHHPAHPLIQQTGFKTLYNLSTNSVHHGAIIFRKGGWRVVRHAQLACPDDPILQRYGWLLMIQLLVMFLLHWLIWVLYHVGSIY